MPSEVTAITGAQESIAFSRGRRSLEQSVWYSGWLTTFLASGQDTQGQFALLEQSTRKGNVPPPHIHHKEDETFYVLEGEMTFSVGDQTIKATPGTMVFLPRNVMHCFTIDSDEVRLLVQLTPAGLEGFFKELSVPAPSMTLPPPANSSTARSRGLWPLRPNTVSRLSYPSTETELQPAPTLRQRQGHACIHGPATRPSPKLGGWRCGPCLNVLNWPGIVGCMPHVKKAWGCEIAQPS